MRKGAAAPEAISRTISCGGVKQKNKDILAKSTLAPQNCEMGGEYETTQNAQRLS